MSDDLIRNLETGNTNHVDAGMWMKDAAARIRELEAERDEANERAYDREIRADVWHEESRLQYHRAEAAEAEVIDLKGELRAQLSRLTAEGDAFAAYMHPQDDEARGHHMRAYRKWEAAKQEAFRALASDTDTGET